MALFLPLVCATLLIGVRGNGSAQAEPGIAWPDQLTNPDWKPRTGFLRPWTAIAGQDFHGPTLRWRGPGAGVKWTLVNPPSGMSLDTSNTIVWPEAAEGRYLVRIQAQYGAEIEETDWFLNVLRAEMQDVVVFPTRHMDYLVPPSYAAWMQSSGAASVIDAYYEFGRDLVGGLPSDARQSIIYTPSMGGAHSGDPIVSGPFTFGDNDVNRWRLGFLFHELAHDFNAWTRVDIFESGDSTMDTCLHGMVEFDKIAWVNRLLESPDSYGVKTVPPFVEQMKVESMEWVPEFRSYKDYAAGGGEFLHYDKGLSPVWAGMIHELAFSYGPEVLEKTIRAIRKDGIPLDHYPASPMSTVDRFTTLLCIMSNAAGQDLKKQFHDAGMPINDKLFDRLNPRFAKDMTRIPAMGKNGATLCPSDGHYYLLTPYGTTWAVAESTARRMGGHLATIRSAAQEDWLSNKFGPDGWLWVGCRRTTPDSPWKWITGEATGMPIWEPERPESDPAKTCGVLILHEDAGKPPWFGLANRPPDEAHFGIIELNHPPRTDIDDLP